MNTIARLLLALFQSPTAVLDNEPVLRFLRYKERHAWHWVHPSGHVYPVIAGGDGPTTLDITELLAKREALAKQLGDPSFSGDLDALVAEAEEVRKQIEEHNKRNEPTPEAVEAEKRRKADAARAALMGVTVVDEPVPQTVVDDVISAAERFLRSERWADFQANGYKGKVGFEVRGLELRAPLDNTATSAGAFQNPPTATTMPVTNADRPLRLRDLLDKGTTSNNTVEYVRDTTPAGGGSAAETAEGAVKPESTYTFEVVTDSVRTVAHWVQITRQAAEDNEQIVSYIRGRLTYGVEFREDAQIINGNGTSPNLRGILNTTGINTRAPTAAEARVITIRKAITDCQIDEYQPTGVALHPSDWELVELSTDSNGMFRVSPNVANTLAPRIWGLQVVTTTAIASGTGLVGDFRMGATLWDRRQVQVFVTDSHASTFTSNILTLLAEKRVALSVWRPAAFCKITFNGTT